MFPAINSGVEFAILHMDTAPSDKTPITPKIPQVPPSLILGIFLNTGGKFVITGKLYFSSISETTSLLKSRISRTVKRASFSFNFSPRSILFIKFIFKLLALYPLQICATSANTFMLFLLNEKIT